MPNKESITRQLIRRARKVLERDGWMKGRLHEKVKFTGVRGEGFGRHCALGGLDKAFIELLDEGIDKETLTVAWTRAANELETTVMDNTMFRSVPEFNDAPETTKEDVFQMFTKTIQRLKAR